MIGKHDIFTAGKIKQAKEVFFRTAFLVMKFMDFHAAGKARSVFPQNGQCFIGGIIIPDTAKEKPLQGNVLAVGAGTKDEEMVVKEGDKVLYGKYSGTELEFEGKKYLIMRQSDILAILG